MDSRITSEQGVGCEFRRVGKACQPRCQGVHAGCSEGNLQDTLPEERKTGPAIGLALHQFQAMDLAFSDAVTPFQGEPGGDGRQILSVPKTRSRLQI
jgi:hypothetical protein